jgi:hypothetical protein
MKYTTHLHLHGKLKYVYYVNGLIDGWIKQAVHHIYTLNEGDPLEIYVSHADGEIRFVNNTLQDTHSYVVYKESTQIMFHVGDNWFEAHGLVNNFVSDLLADGISNNRPRKVLTRDYVKLDTSSGRSANIIRDIEHVIYAEKRMFIRTHASDVLHDLLIVTADDE